MIGYNCRSANSWKDDLALTVTYFPRTQLVFAILFGCTAATEKQVLNRLAGASSSASHPMLLPGIFAEPERIRMLEVVEKTIDDIEGAIYELNSGEATREVTTATATGEEAGRADTAASRPRFMRRIVWLNTTFLRSRLQIWRTQLRKMVEHVDELADRGPYDLAVVDNFERSDDGGIGLARTNAMIEDRLCASME